MTALSGVRSSWLMLAQNSDFARRALSARRLASNSRATSFSRSALFRISAMSDANERRAIRLRLNAKAR